MATTERRKSRPGLKLLSLAILTAVIFGAVGLGTLWSDASWSPKLAIDLDGGTQITLTPTTTDGSKVTSSTIDESINVIRQRIDGAGVSEAQISRLGSNNIVVAIPGKPSQETIDSVSKAAQMRIRPVLVIGSPLTAAQQSAAATPAPTSTAPATPAATPSPTATVKGSAFRGESPHTANAVGAAYVKAADATPAPTPDPTATTGTDSSSADGLSSLDQITPAIQKQYDDLDCTDPKSRVSGGTDDASKPLVTCQDDGSAKYILGPVEIEGTEISSATSGLETTSQGVTTNNWVVNIKFSGKGAKAQTAMTKRIAGLESPRNQFGMVLDGLVISAPSVDAQYAETGITGNQSQISGNFTRSSAATLANQLNFGSLPLTFDVKSQEQISATLGSEQLERGLLAGLIGMVLVVIYSLFQYRLLGLLTVASLVVAGIMTFGLITLLSWTQGYRLSLPGVAGLIVAIGFTADSFIVYFERIRDELRDGRPLSGAVERGWTRARRTVLAAKTVNLISAIVLYYLAVGGVQGFAYTLGLTTIVDVIVVFWFTHPMMELLARVPYFRDGHRFSGLSPEQLQVRSGARYAGAGRVKVAGLEGGAANEETPPPDSGAIPPDEPVAATVSEAPVEESLVLTPAAPRPAVATPDGRRMTIAERRAAERRAASGTEQTETASRTRADQDGTNEESR